jgi:hypothetical protein
LSRRRPTFSFGVHRIIDEDILWIKQIRVPHVNPGVSRAIVGGMGYEREHLLLKAVGHFGSSSSPLDQWSTGLRLAVVGGTPPATGGLVSFLENISVPFQTFHQDSTTAASTVCFLDELTVAHIGLDGKYASEFTETVRRPYGSPVQGTGTATHPWNTAHVISLRTLKKRGLASNGRMYYPALGMLLTGATGRLGSSAVLNRVDAAKTLFDAVNVAAQSASSGLRIHVLSKGSKNPATGGFGTGWSALVTSIRCDARLDSIERRENQQPPTWTSANLA